MPDLAPPSLPPALHGRLTSIDALRGFAICWVVLYHVWTDLRYPNVYPVQGDAFRAAGSRLLDGNLLGAAAAAVSAFLRVGYLGVPLFMLLSGLSLTLAASRRPVTAPWRSFALRRLRRVMIPYWFGFAFTVAFALALAAVQWLRHGGDAYAVYVRRGDIPLDPGRLLAGALVLPRIFRDEWQFAPEGSLWFVLVILQYYLLFPLLLHLLRRLGPLVFAAASLAVTWGSLAMMAALAGGLLRYGTWVQMAAPFRLFEFAAGMALAALVARSTGSRSPADAAPLQPLAVDSASGSRAILRARAVNAAIVIAGVALFVAAALIDVASQWPATLQSPAVVLAFVLIFGHALVPPRTAAAAAPASSATSAAHAHAKTRSRRSPRREDVPAPQRPSPPHDDAFAPQRPPPLEDVLARQRPSPHHEDVLVSPVRLSPLRRIDTRRPIIRALAWVGPVSYTVLIVSEPLRSVTHTMSAERAPDAAILAWVAFGMLPLTFLAATPLAHALGLIERDSPPTTITDLIGAPVPPESIATQTPTPDP